MKWFSFLLNDAHSGGVTGDRGQVAGFLSAALLKTPWDGEFYG